MDLGEHLADPGRRQAFVTRMFDIIAPRYDRFTRVFSYRMDAAWKRELLELLPALGRDDVAVDLACGTGDLALSVRDRSAQATIFGLDASSRMVAEGRRRAADRNVAFSVGDMTRLPLANGSVRLITAGYGYRNVSDWRRALEESARVLEPGGSLLVLDFYRPRSLVWRTLFLAYLRVAGQVVGWLWHGEAVVYGYIAPSIDAYVDAGTFTASLGALGFEVKTVREKLFGGVALHVARRIATASAEA